MHARLGPRTDCVEDALEDRLTGLVEDVVVDVFGRPARGGEEALNLSRHVNRECEQLFRARYEVPVDRSRAQVIMLGQCLVLETQQPSAARRQRLASHQKCRGRVPERQAGGQVRDVVERLEVDR